MKEYNPLDYSNYRIQRAKETLKEIETCNYSGDQMVLMIHLWM